MPGCNPRIHVGKLWKLTAIMTLASGVLALGAVFGARLPNRDICVMVNVPGDTGNYSRIFDIARGLALPDPRSGPLLYDSISPDRRSYVQIRPDRSGSYTLVVREFNGDNARILQEGAALTVPDMPTNMVNWSPDSRRVAYIWNARDGSATLSTANSDGSDKRSAPFTRWDGGTVTPTNSFVVSWSGDHTYVLVRERRGSLERSYALWSLADMRAVGTRFDGQLDSAVWSPQGHWLAAIRETEGGAQQLVILSPDGGENEVVERLLLNRVQLLAWSPNGQYVAAISQAQVCHANRCAMRWQYDIFQGDGTQVQAHIIGSQLLPGDGILGTEPEVVPAAWSPEGDRWLYLHERLDGETLVTDLVGLDVANGREETLAAHVIARFTEGIFHLPWEQSYQARIADDNFVMPSARFLVLPRVADDDKVTVEFVDLENDLRFTLVEGADQVLPVVVGIAPSSMQRTFWAEAEWLMIPWVVHADGKAQAHITVARRDGSYRFETPNPVEAITQMQWINEEWLGFLGQREGVLGLEIVNVITGEQRQLLSALEAQPFWQASAAPQGGLVGLTIQGGLDPLRQGSLYLLSLDDLSLKAVSFEVAQYNGSVWSPDGSAFAFLSDNDQKDAMVQVVTAEGEIVWGGSIGQMTAWGAWVSGFTRCE